MADEQEQRPASALGEDRNASHEWAYAFRVPQQRPASALGEDRNVWEWIIKPAWDARSARRPRWARIATR